MYMYNFGLLFDTIFIFSHLLSVFFLFLARTCSSEGVASSAVGGAETAV